MCMTRIAGMLPCLANGTKMAVKIFSRKREVTAYLRGRQGYAILFLKGDEGMLVEMVVENFFSFREENSFSMVASTVEEHPQTVSDTEAFPICNVAAIYGANASGKSNLLKAMSLMKEGVLLAPGEGRRWLSKIEPFHLDEATEAADTLLEVSFVAAGKLFRYGFFVNREEIREEYLYREDGEQEVYFQRTATEGLVEGRWLAQLQGQRLESDRLLLAELFRDAPDALPELPALRAWFEETLVVMDAMNLRLDVSMAKIHLQKYKHNLLELIRVADSSIHDIECHSIPNPRTGKDEDQFYVVKLKRKRDGSQERVRESFRFHDVESAGTVKLLALAGPIIDALEKGSLLMVDEMDRSFHSLMTKYVLELFRSEFNKRGAQLIFSTHDISNLTSTLFRRDQVWFVEKGTDGASSLISLVEFTFEDSERKNSFEFYQNYLNGKYGAVPYLPPVDWWESNGHDEGR